MNQRAKRKVLLFVLKALPFVFFSYTMTVKDFPVCINKNANCMHLSSEQTSSRNYFGLDKYSKIR